PDRAAATVLPPLAGPGFLRGRHGLIRSGTVFGAWFSGDGVEAPDLIAGCRVVRGDIAPQRTEIRATEPDHHFSIEYARRATDGRPVPGVYRLYRPGERALLRIQGDQTTITGSGVHTI